MFRVICMLALVLSSAIANTSKATESQNDYLVIIKKFSQTFEPGVAQAGYKLDIYIDEGNPEVSAHAEILGHTFQIHINGGFLRYPDLNANSLILALCHETGHLLAGHPFLDEFSNYSSEGQSDYFATALCMPYFLNKNRVVPDIETLRSYGKICRSLTIISGAIKRNCEIALDASFRISAMAATLGGQAKPIIEPSFLSQIKTRGVTLTPQCRLDTFISGYLLEKTWSLPDLKKLLPRKDLDPDRLKKYSNLFYSTIDSIFSKRPNCWYKD